MASHRKTPRATENWSNPPPEILSAIKKRLNSTIDVLRCRSVCKNWRDSINPNPNSSILSPFLPLKISNPTLPFNNRPNETLILFARTVLLVKPLSSSNDDSTSTSSWILTAEEVTQGKLRILHPLSNDRVTSLPPNFPKSWNLLDFSVSEICKSYGFKHASDGKDVCGVHKVVFCSDFTAMVLYGEGILVSVRLKKGKWGFVRDSLVTPFSDVILFNGNVCAVDCNRNVHTIDHKMMKVIKSVVDDRILRNSLVSTNGGKRLVERKGKLLLVTWWIGKLCSTDRSETVEVMCYDLNEKLNAWFETRLLGFVLFLSLNWCFLVCPKDLGISDYLPKIGEQEISSCSYGIDDLQYDTNFPPWDVKRREYLVLSRTCFNSSALPVFMKYNSQYFEGARVNFSVGLFNYMHEEHDRRNYIYSSIRGAIWPPPIWFWRDDDTSSRDDEDDEDLEFCVEDVSTDSKQEMPPSLIVPAVNGIAKNNAQDLRTKEIDMSTFLEDSHALRIQNVNSCASTALFERVKIKANLLTTLQNIWAKHGNILEESRIRSGDLIAKALESLATTVLILQRSSGRSLNYIQAEYLSSTLSDLQHMHCKVDWLVPFIEKALAVHKSKPLVDSLKEHDEAKARVKDTKLKLLNELAKLDEVEDDMKLVFETIPCLESVDLNESLGEGIC